MIVRGFRPSWSGRRGLGVGRGLECGALEVGDGLIRPWFGAVRVVLPGVDVSGLVSKLSGSCLDSLTSPLQVFC